MIDLSEKIPVTDAFDTIKIALNYYSVVVLDLISTVDISQLDNVQRIQRGSQ